MAHIITRTAPAESVSFFTKARRFMKAYAKHRRDQLTYRRMLKMSNRDLSDIGLTRDDVREAMMHTFSRPGAH
ncbi:DUF1127 domain-containing protein [uncultured Roseovarius sp.]|uniref:DUF1127 domain-containing protein n=1 Tax=Roseovarius sp. TaxID=1486281 RepID=UPI0025F1BF77|nr:DUF1127 domain-containing protein [uncultured Roseovarius sp.]